VIFDLKFDFFIVLWYDYIKQRQGVGFMKHKRIKRKIKNQMKEDILACEKEISKGAPNAILFEELKSRYTLIDKKFFYNMTSYVKTFNTNYVHELEYIKTKLDMYLKLNRIPLEDDENIDSNKNVSINKVVIKGNVGSQNSYQKNTTVSPTISFGVGKGKFDFFKKIFNRD